MCGIVGFIRNDGRDINAPVLEQMCAAITHRGPDEDGFYRKGHVGLAMRRLSIIDLAGGQQPIANPTRTAWIVFNGEIYNYQELRADLEKLGHTFRTNSDTEAIIQLYDRYGAECVKHLRGMFAFAIWDEAKQELFLARDRVGKKPLLYANLNGQLIFGSEFQALLQHPDISREVEPAALHHYLSFMCVPAPLTAYKQIRKLEPGHWLRWRRGEIEIQRYWLPEFAPKLRLSEAEAGAQALATLREAVRLRLISEVPLGAFLSGGVDSSAVVALMAQESSTPVKTFSIGFEEQDFSELHHARRVAEHLGAEHHEFIVKPDALEVLPTLVEHYGEPYADSSAVPTYYVARETRRHVTVALNGDGGDETFAGYERYAAMRLAERYHHLPRFLRSGVVEPALTAVPVPGGFRNRAVRFQRFLRAASLPRDARYLRWVSAFDEPTKRELYTADFAREVSAAHSAEVLRPWLQHAENKGLGIVDATLLTDTLTYLPNDLLAKVDIATMAVSLEARSPFLDHHVIEFAARLPEGLKLRGFTTKYLLKKVLEQLLPAENLKRPKMGFGVPVGHWFRGPLQDFLRGTLLSDKAMQRNILRADAVRRLIDDHTARRADYAHQLWTLLMLELWFQRFID